jgi:hypothetical protein
LWSGSGLTSSNAVMNPLMGLAAIANEKRDGSGNMTPLFTSFGTEAVDINSIIVKYTLNGDADLNGRINFDDYFQINTGFLSGGTLMGYRWGDFDYSGKINFDDYWLINQAFLGQDTIHLSTMQAMIAVPEPSALGLLGICAGLLLRRRRR